MCNSQEIEEKLAALQARKNELSTLIIDSYLEIVELEEEEIRLKVNLEEVRINENRIELIDRMLNHE